MIAFKVAMVLQVILKDMFSVQDATITALLGAANAWSISHMWSLECL
jgi:hypothetical protein